jgi:hypothetical protein
MVAQQGESPGNGASGGRRPVPLFDPVAGMRAMADIQAEGLRAASDLLERVLEPEDREPMAPPSSPASDTDYAELVNAWGEMLRQVAAALARPEAQGRLTIPIDGGVGPPVWLALEVEGGEQPARTTGEFWLHNGTAAAVGPLALRCGALSTAGGEVLDARVRFEPADVAELPARSSRGVVVSVTPSGRPDPGVYRGTIQAEGAPALWLPLELAVK